MKLIVLRHFKRGGSPLFDTSLTEEGLKDAENIVEELRKLRINDIYCSPFLRTVQSIYPFATKYNKTINIDNAIHEGTNDLLFNDTNINNHYSFHNKKYNLSGIINTNYRNSLLICNIYPQEGNDRIIERVHTFINSLISNKNNKGKTILIVTHQCICNAIKKYFDNKVEINDNFPMGTFEIINII